MMRHEFIERTGYTPEIRRAENGFDIEYDEYEYIEMSYYDSECVNKDEFCREWKKNYKAGYWKRELELLKKVKSLTALYCDECKKSSEQNKAIGDLIDKNFELKKEVEQSRRKLERIQNIVTGVCQIAG